MSRALTLELLGQPHKQEIPIDLHAVTTINTMHKHSSTAAQYPSLLHLFCLVRAERSQGDRRRTAILEAKHKEREAVADGKKPYYLKGSEKKRLSLEQRYGYLYMLSMTLLFFLFTASSTSSRRSCVQRFSYLTHNDYAAYRPL